MELCVGCWFYFPEEVMTKCKQKTLCLECLTKAEEKEVETGILEELGNDKQTD